MPFRIIICEHTVFQAHYLVADVPAGELAVEAVEINKCIFQRRAGDTLIVHLRREFRKAYPPRGEVSCGGRSKAHLRQCERRQCQRGEESGDPAGKL